ncbi:MAG: alpha-amylase family glycosyl hydrolase [Athalassotoga sp.]|uniref:alpha-amylase family glycosyl hydrolase n=1 Tax=Athalassotoga sp. TaxID=2022597 RepID=UPI003D079EF7
MALNTSKDLEKIVIYEVFARAYGGFSKVEADLERIKNLGVDYVWFMPVHPTGIENRKGTLGSPYAIRDYRSIDPSLGSEDEFKHLISSIHNLGMKAMMDVVFNHMATDSVLATKHPEWFMRDGNGKPTRKIADWSDIIDFDFSNPALSEYLIDTLKFWVKNYDIDGFRCDVAGLVPIGFWNRARSELENVKNLVWLSESKDPYLYQAFDITYDYDSYDILKAYFAGQNSLSNYASNFEYQKQIFDDHIKLRFLENHDQERIAKYVGGKLRAWTTLLMVQKGAILLYNGQEFALKDRLDIFNEFHLDFSKGDKEFEDFMRNLIRLRKNMPALSYGKMDVLKNSDPQSVISILRRAENSLALYVGNLISGGKVQINFGNLNNVYIHAFDHLKGEPITFYIDRKSMATFDIEDYLLLSSYKAGI